MLLKGYLTPSTKLRLRPVLPGMLRTKSRGLPSLAVCLPGGEETELRSHYQPADLNGVLCRATNTTQLMEAPAWQTTLGLH